MTPPPMPQSAAPETLYLKRLRLRDMRGFQEAEVDFLDAEGGPRQITLLVGINGAGKSTFLRALAIGLCQQKEASSLVGELTGDFVRITKKGKVQPGAEIVLELVDPDRPDDLYRTRTRVERDASGQEILTKTTEPAENFPWEAIFACGYGVNRGTGRRSEQPPSTYSRRDALSTLFDDNATLLDPEDTLRALKLAVTEVDYGNDRFEAVLRHVKALLQLASSYRIAVSSTAVNVHGPWGGLPFHALGDGYRGTAGWFLDLCRRAHIGGRLGKKGMPSGIVLIDELDEHLHPSWQKGLVPLLRKRFPGLQFVGTTHSPMSIVNCRSDELLATDLKNTIATIAPLPAPQGRTADAVLRGEWFGLESTVDNASQRAIDSYEKAVRSGREEAEIAPLREEVRQHLGRLAESPVDELALRIADEVREQVRAATSGEQRQLVIAKAADRLRSKLTELKSSSGVGGDRGGGG